MRVVLGKEQYHFTFQTIHYKNPIQRPHSGKWAKGETSCTIYRQREPPDDGRMGIIEGVGTAYCSCSEEFHKRTGQKYALERALDDAWPLYSPTALVIDPDPALHGRIHGAFFTASPLDTHR